MPRIFALLLVLLPFPAAALEIRVHPGDVVYAYEVDPARGLYTVVLQNVAVVQKEGGPVTIDSLEIQAVNGGQVAQTLVISAAEIDKGAQRLAGMEAQGLLKAYDFHFQTSRYLAGLHVSGTRTLNPGTALVVFGKPLLLLGLPSDGLALIAHGKDAAGKPVEARATLRVEDHRSPNEYTFPLAGTWYVGAGPTLHSHHRWAADQEFAFDLVALGPDGHTHKGNGSRLDDYYDYGRDVLAVADGTVVELATDGTEANDRLQRLGESSEDFMKRTVQAQNELLMKNPKSVIGNYVVIRHAGSEYSQYAHLKQGSVRVKAGDAVTRGQVIGQLGHTDGADPLYSRGIPVTFKNTSVEGDGFEGRPLQSGWIVTAGK
jgi:murein DD-endopeptidase MepM/ murein hydrolase activator NlpD